jgi:PhnB protein
MQVSIYLFFRTGCEAALEFYAACGLGRVTAVLRHGVNGMPAHDETMRGRIAHARFEGPGVLFFASDNHDAEPMRGSTHIITLTDRDRTKQLFQQLSAGGQVTTPLGLQPWGDFYGKLTDRFGVQWMLNCTG